MPTAGGPNTLGESNLVFAYDTGDVSNSYIGEPTVNIHANSENVSSWTGNLFGNWIDSGVSSNTVVAPNGTLTGDIIGDGFGRFNASSTATPGQTYTYSVYLKNISLTSGFYIWYAFGLNGSLVSYGQSPLITIASLSNTEWTRFTVTVTAPGSGINQVQFGPCPFTSYNYGPTYSSPTYNASGAQLAVWGGQIEQKSHVTPYTAGTRSATQGLLPLIGNSTIDLTNVSFDSSAQMTFDGTNDYLTTTTTPTSLQGNSTFSVEGIFKRNGDIIQQGFWGIGGGTTPEGICSWNMTLTNEIGIDLWGTSTYGTGQTYSTTEWKHIVWTYNGTSFTTSNINIYVNGVKYTGGNLITRRGGSGAPNINNSGITVGRIHSGTVGYHASGQVPVFKTYSKILSDNEVRQNYQQYKTRFNLS